MVTNYKWINFYRRKIFSRQFYDFKSWGLSRWVRKLFLQVLFIESQCSHFCLYLRSSNKITLRSMCYRKTISKSRNYDWRLRRERVDWWRDISYACKDNSIICLVDIAAIIILVSYFICLVSIVIFFALVIFLFSLLLLKRAFTL